MKALLHSDVEVLSQGRVKKVKDLKAGDQIMDANTEYARIKSIRCVSLPEAVEITTNQSFFVHPDQIFLTQKNKPKLVNELIPTDKLMSFDIINNKKRFFPINGIVNEKGPFDFYELDVDTTGIYITTDDIIV